jgi:hypothetical protein
MGYSDNREFVPLTNKVSLYSDGCGETYEQKHYCNGAYIDLCGLSIEEYMSNPCCGGNGGSGSDSDNALLKNKIQIISYEQDELILYQAIATYPVTSNLKIRVHSQVSDSITELDIYIGETTSKPEAGETLSIKEAVVDIKEDENFQYVLIIGGSEIEEEMVYNVYVGALHLNELEGLGNEAANKLQLIEIKGGKAVDVQFVIPGTDIDTGEMEEPEFMEFCQNNQYTFVILVPEQVYQDGKLKLYNYGGSDMTYKFPYNAEYIIDGENYICVNEKATEDIMPYVPLYGEDITYEYKLTINN